MSVQTTTISVFHPNSRKVATTIQSVIPKQTVDSLTERLGQEAGEQARKTLSAMQRNGLDMAQFSVGERRIRIKQEA
jgi:hypothetical protein